MPTSAVLRILDANLNRAREALRVVEDYARFALNDDALCGALKALRHDLAEATRTFASQAILHRDTPGDVGTDNKTASELTRSSLSHVVTAAGKRLGEALRVIEEVLKVERHEGTEAQRHEGGSSLVEQIRYRFYSLEQQIARTLRPATRFADVRLYVLITEQVCSGPWISVAEQAILGGADCLQLREKSLDGGEFLRRARQIVDLCRRHGVLCIINDRPDIALLSGADGVHVGQEDLPCVEVRKIVGNDLLIGVSTHRIEQARQAVLDGADYIGVGPVFRSSTKSREILPGLEYAAEVAREISIPAVAIAGITLENVAQVAATGIRAVAVTAAIAGAADVCAAAREMKRILSTPNVGADIPVCHELASGGHSCPPEATRSGGADIPVCHELASGGHSCPPEATRSPSPELHKSRRRLPHWVLEGSTYFITARVIAGELAPAERSIVLDQLRTGDTSFYQLLAAVVMPDHVHCLLIPNSGVELSRITKGFKGIAARRINEGRGAHGQLWQDESWDRIVRDNTEFEEKLRYMLNNPVKRGLCGDGWDYQWWYVKEGVTW